MNKISLTFLFVFLVIAASCANEKKTKESNSQICVDSFANSLVIPFKYVTVRISRMYGTPILKKDSIAKLDTIKFTLGMAGIDADIHSKLLQLVECKVDSIAILERYCSTLFFNNDGSGGVYRLENISESCTDWKTLKQLVEGNYRTSSMRKRDPIFPRTTENDQRIAEEYVNGKGKKMYATYSLGISNVYYRIIAHFSDGRVVENIIHFEIQPGD